MLEKAIPRHGFQVQADGAMIGTVTSGTMSPVLDKGIGLAYVATNAAKIGNRIQILIRDKAALAEIVKIPFLGK